MNPSETYRGLTDRGIGWQAAGFTLVATASVVTLERTILGFGFLAVRGIPNRGSPDILGVGSAIGRAI